MRPTADPKGLAPGTYKANVVINAGAAGTGSVPITLTVSPVPGPPTGTTTGTGTSTGTGTGTSTGTTGAGTGTTTPTPPAPSVSDRYRIPHRECRDLRSDASGAGFARHGDGFESRGQDRLGYASTVVARTCSTTPPIRSICWFRRPCGEELGYDGGDGRRREQRAADGHPGARHGRRSSRTACSTRTTASTERMRPPDRGAFSRSTRPAFRTARRSRCRSGDRKDLVPLYAGPAPTVPGVQQVNVAVPDRPDAGPRAAGGLRQYGRRSSSARRLIRWRCSSGTGSRAGLAVQPGSCFSAAPVRRGLRLRRRSSAAAGECSRAISDLAAVQRGGRLIVHFTPPRNHRAWRIKSPLRLDLRIGTAVAPFNADGLGRVGAADRAGRCRKTVSPSMRFRPRTGWAKRSRLQRAPSGRTGRTAPGELRQPALSCHPPAAPSDVTAAATPDGVRLTWQGGPGRVSRLPPRRRGERSRGRHRLRSPSCVDRYAEFGKPYTYEVQRIAPAGQGRRRERISAPFTITPVDTFPPAAPPACARSRRRNPSSSPGTGTPSPISPVSHLPRDR